MGHSADAQLVYGHCLGGVDHWFILELDEDGDWDSPIPDSPDPAEAIRDILITGVAGFTELDPHPNLYAERVPMGIGVHYSVTQQAEAELRTTQEWRDHEDWAHARNAAFKATGLEVFMSGNACYRDAITYWVVIEKLTREAPIGGATSVEPSLMMAVRPRGAEDEVLGRAMSALGVTPVSPTPSRVGSWSRDAVTPGWWLTSSYG